ncbi:hypothetical protein ACOMHN_048877 [Nucella lapillus]
MDRSDFCAFTSRRRKFDEAEESNKELLPCSKVPRREIISVNEKDYVVGDAGVGGNGQFDDCDMDQDESSTPAGQQHQSTLTSAIGNSGDMVMMEFTVPPPPAQSDWAGQGDQTNFSCTVRSEGKVLAQKSQETVSVSPVSSQLGFCLQCYFGESGHFHHIMSRSYDLEKQ